MVKIILDWWYGLTTSPSTSNSKRKRHQRIKVINKLVFACMIKKEGYDINMPFRYCPSCGELINETEKDVKELLSK